MINDHTTHERLVYTVAEVQELLGLSRGLAYEAINRGEIPSLRIGRRILIPRAALERLLLERGSSEHTASLDISSSGENK